MPTLTFGRLLLTKRQRDDAWKNAGIVAARLLFLGTYTLNNQRLRQQAQFYCEDYEKRAGISNEYPEYDQHMYWSFQNENWTEFLAECFIERLEL